MGLGIYGSQTLFHRPTMQRYGTRKPKSILFITVYSLFISCSQFIHSAPMLEPKIIINGGNIQINENCTNVTQHNYDDGKNQDRNTEQMEIITPLPDAEEESMGELARLSININKVKLQEYLSQIAECRNATEVAMVAVRMMEQEPYLTPDDIVKERFIEQILPFATKVTKGNSISNLRARINDALDKRPRHKK